MRRGGPRYNEAQARAAIAASRSYSEALRRLGMRAAGGNHRTIRRYAEEVWRIPVVCPSCNATLDTHFGRNGRLPASELSCPQCGTAFLPRTARQRYCSRECGQRAPGRRGPQPARRRTVRPPYEQLVREIDELGYVGVGRKYGVSDNAVRKWRRAYEAEHGGVGSARGRPEPEHSEEVTPGGRLITDCL